MAGSSGAVYGIRLLEVLHGQPGVETHLVITKAAEINVEHETDQRADACKRLAIEVRLVSVNAGPLLRSAW
jgi:4-hydroxy-3-polyprenylbenzoate decarboxylase